MMAYPKVESAIDIAYCFFDKAENDNLYLDAEKVQLLLFWAQLTFAKVYNQQMLCPALFVCDENGVYEPNLNKILALGRPFLPLSKFPPMVNDFLSDFWKKFAHKTYAELLKLVKSSPVYRDFTKSGAKTLIDFNSMIESLNKYCRISDYDEGENSTKILLSQNGPVVVSKWKPRKVSD